MTKKTRHMCRHPGCTYGSSQLHIVAQHERYVRHRDTGKPDARCAPTSEAPCTVYRAPGDPDWGHTEAACQAAELGCEWGSCTKSFKTHKLRSAHRNLKGKEAKKAKVVHKRCADYFEDAHDQLAACRCDVGRGSAFAGCETALGCDHCHCRARLACSLVPHGVAGHRQRSTR